MYSAPNRIWAVFFQSRTWTSLPSTAPSSAQIGSMNVVLIWSSFDHWVHWTSALKSNRPIGRNETPPAAHSGQEISRRISELPGRSKRVMFDMRAEPSKVMVDGVRTVRPILMVSIGLTRTPKVAPKPQPVAFSSYWPKSTGSIEIGKDDSPAGILRLDVPQLMFSVIPTDIASLSLTATSGEKEKT